MEKRVSTDDARQQRLSAFILSRLDAPFAWGTNDCCRFACAGVKEITGSDPSAALGAYATEREALRALRRYGRVHGVHPDLPSVVIHGLGQLPPAPAAQRCPGDLLLLENARTVLWAYSLGLTGPSGECLTMHPGGMIQVQENRIARCWHT